MTPVCCEQCNAPVPETARFCLQCGARTGRRPDKPFTFLTLILYALVGMLLAIALVPRLAPGILVRSARMRAPAAGPLDQDATVIADSFCSESDGEVLQLYALIAQGDRNAAAAVVLRDTTFAVSAGTLVHEDSRSGRLSHIRIGSSDAKVRVCWIPTIMLTGVVGHTAGPRAAPVIVESSPSEPN